MRLSQSELDKYHEQGYVVPDARLEDKAVSYTHLTLTTKA